MLMSAFVDIILREMQLVNWHTCLLSFDL